jgi:site-specific DNA recombinase
VKSGAINEIHVKQGVKRGVRIGGRAFAAGFLAEQNYNLLDAQRDACEAYIASQKSEGWVALPDAYNDGGFSGGTLNRPGEQRLLDDVREGLVDVIVVYKIDRLSRSLADFAKLVELFDAQKVTFVSRSRSNSTPPRRWDG